MNITILASVEGPDEAYKLLLELVDKGIEGHRFWMVLPGRLSQRWLLLYGSALVGPEGLARAAEILNSPRQRPQLSLGLAGYLHDRGLPFSLAVDTEFTVNRGHIVFALQAPTALLGYQDLRQILHRHDAKIFGETPSLQLRPGGLKRPLQPPVANLARKTSTVS